MIAPTVFGPSNWMTCSRCCSARSVSCSGLSDQNGERYGYGPKKCTCWLAYSFGQRRGSPVAVIAAPVLPW